jgi:hypothetical protein
VRDSAIQRFEISFELCWKFLKAYLEEQHNASCTSPRTCFRAAFKHGVIDNDPFGIDLTVLRDYTVYTYNEQLAATELSSRLDPEDLREVIAAYHRDLLSRRWARAKRADKIAEHHRQLPAFGVGGLGAFSRWFRRPLIAQRGDRSEQPAAVPYGIDPDFPEVVGRQLRQYCDVDLVRAERLLVLLQPETVEPCRNIHALLPGVVTVSL